MNYRKIGEWSNGDVGVYTKEYADYFVTYIPSINYIGKPRTDKDHPEATYDNWIHPESINYDYKERKVHFRGSTWSYANEELTLDTGAIVRGNTMTVGDYMQYA